MILDDPQSLALKRYLIDQLEPICEADPKVLAEYVLALLKHDKPNQDLRQLCTKELEDFLKDQTEPFVRRLFDTLANDDYLRRGDVVTRQDLNPSHLSPQSALESTSQVDRRLDTRSEPHDPSSRHGTHPRDESDGSEDDDDDRNFKHRRRGSETRDDYRKPPTERHGSYEDKDPRNKRFQHGQNVIPAGSSLTDQYGSSAFNSRPGNGINGDDRTFKRRHPEEEEDPRLNKHFRSNVTGPPGQTPAGVSNNYANNGNLVGYGSRRPDFDGRSVSRNLPTVPSNQSMSPVNPPTGPARWENPAGVSDWQNGSGMRAGDRYDDMRGGNRLRGRVGDRVMVMGGRGGLGTGRGGFVDSRDTPRRQRCRDYDEKGYCMRGDLCPFDHGVDRIVVDDIPIARPFDIMPPVSGGPLPGPTGIMNVGRPPYFIGGIRNQFTVDNNFPSPVPATLAPSEEYDPARATLSRPEDLSVGQISPTSPQQSSIGENVNSSETTVSLTSPNVPHFMDEAARTGLRGGIARGRGGRGRVRSGALQFSGRYGHAKQNTTLVVENIPDEFCAIDKVNDFFKKFGTITNITLERQLHKAIVQFSTNSEASSAYNSPEAIFDNRFVKVYWQKVDKDEEIKPSNGGSVSTPKDPLVTAVAAPPEVANKMAAETAKEREEKARKHQEHLKVMLDIQKQKEQLIQRQIEEQKLLMEKLAKSKTLNPKDRDEIFKSLSKVSAEMKPTVTPVTPLTPTAMSTTKRLSVSGAPSKSILEEKERERLDRELDLLSQMNEHNTSEPKDLTTEALKAKVASLQAEADSLGIENVGSAGAFRGVRGGYFRGGRGAQRGSWPRVRGGGVQRSYKLDNRTTKLLVKNIPDEAKDKLRSHFEKYGEVESLTSADDIQAVVIQFKTRREAEQALLQGTNASDIGASFQIAWHSDLTPASENATNKNFQVNVQEQPAEQEGQGGMEGEEGEGEEGEEEEEEEEEDGDERERFFKR